MRARGNCELWGVDRVTFQKIVLQTTGDKRRLYTSFLEGVPLLGDTHAHIQTRTLTSAHRHPPSTRSTLGGSARGAGSPVRAAPCLTIPHHPPPHSLPPAAPSAEALTDVERGQVADVLAPRTYADGEAIVRLGEEGDAFYIIERVSPRPPAHRTLTPPRHRHS